MKVASALVSGIRPLPNLAEIAVRQAMEKAGIRQATTVFLFLSRNMAHCARDAVVAAAREAGTLQVHGCTGSGIFAPTGWVFGRSAAAALVMDRLIDGNVPGALTLSIAGTKQMPETWQDKPRIGLYDHRATVWHNSHLQEPRQMELSLSGLRCFPSLVTGLRPLAEPLCVNACSGYTLQRVNQKPAYDSLFESISPPSTGRAPLHRLAVQRYPGGPGILITSANPDGSLTLEEKFQPGETLIWCMRQMIRAEKFVHEDMARAKEAMTDPDFALMFSSVQRGPDFFSEDDDMDLRAVCAAYPDLPLIGTYSSGQIAPLGARNPLYDWSVITLLCKADDHV